jgi:polyisoprenoid-binding protein YceI
MRLDTQRSQIGFEVRTRFGQRIEGLFPHFEGASRSCPTAATRCT